MSKIRKQHGSKTKARIALEAFKNESTLSELGRKYEVHAIQVANRGAERLPIFNHAPGGTRCVFSSIVLR
jgi:hypothetical protein